VALSALLSIKVCPPLIAHVDQSPFGSRAPGPLDRVVLALTRSLPANWLGLRLAILFRRMVTMRHREAFDIELWGLRLRLHPLGNGCEKNALFTPQMYDVTERKVLGEAIDRRLAAGGIFTFVDIGANVGLYSLFVAAHARSRARILAIEPQPGILDRLRFNLAANPDVAVEVLPLAVSDREGTVALRIDADDSGGTRIDRDAAAQDGDSTNRDPALISRLRMSLFAKPVPTFAGHAPAASETVTVPCRPLLAILADAGITMIDALKIDVEGAEDLALVPFLRECPSGLLPDLVLIEDTSGAWRTDLFAMLAQHGYTVLARSRHNLALRRG
jgi:FkbM family methyltransferase